MASDTLSGGVGPPASSPVGLAAVKRGNTNKRAATAGGGEGREPRA